MCYFECHNSAQPECKQYSHHVYHVHWPYLCVQAKSPAGYVYVALYKTLISVPTEHRLLRVIATIRKPDMVKVENSHASIRIEPAS